MVLNLKTERASSGLQKSTYVTIFLTDMYIIYKTVNITVILDSLIAFLFPSKLIDINSSCVWTEVSIHPVLAPWKLIGVKQDHCSLVHYALPLLPEIQKIVRKQCRLPDLWSSRTHIFRIHLPGYGRNQILFSLLKRYISQQLSSGDFRSDDVWCEEKLSWQAFFQCYLTFCSSCLNHEGRGCPSLCRSFDSSTLWSL